MYDQKFTLRHAFDNFSTLKEEYSSVEKHFGVPWKIKANHEENSFSLYLYCAKEADKENPWSIEVNYELRLVSVTGKGQVSKEISYKFDSNKSYGWRDFLNWDDIIQNHAVDDTVIVECDVTVKKMTGIAPEKIMDFEEPKENLTDVVLKVGEKEFNVSKVFLSTLSPVFEALFFGNFAESDKSEVCLEDVDPEQFQMFLEAVHGEPSITNDNVENVLKLADRFDVKTVRNRCEEFLFNCKEINSKNKFRIADAYGLTKLQNYCLKDVKTTQGIRALLPADVNDFNQNTLAILLEKAISTV